MTIAGILLMIGAALAGAFILFMAWRSRNSWPPIPEWTWHDIRKLIALLATIAGAIILTAMAWQLLGQLVMMAKGLIHEYLNSTRATAPPAAVGTVLVTVIDALAWGLKFLMAGVIVVLLSLGLVITPRSFDFHGPGGIGGSFGGGDGQPPEVKAAKAVETEVRAAAAGAVDKVEAAAQAPPAHPAAPAADDPAIPDYAKP